MNSITTLFLTFFRICTFRYKPQDLPGSVELLAICLLAYTGINFLLTLTVSTPASAVVSSLLESLLVSLITWFLLLLNRRRERWLQTLLAIAGAGCVIGLLALPLFYLAFMLDSNAGLQALVLMLYLVLLVWNVVIIGNILRHSLETSLGVGVVFAVIYIVITTLVVSQALLLLEPQ